jgi:hypothetical protein
MRKQAWNYEVGGDVEEFRTSDKQDYVRMNPTKAYPDKELKRWKRNIVLEKPEITLILDEIDAEPGSKIEVRFHPGVDFEVQDDIALLEGKNGNMALIPLSKEALKIQPGRHACQYVNATSRFFWEDYFDTEITSKDNKTIIATIIIPVEDSGEAGRIASTKELKLDGSGNVTVSFSRKGEQYSYHFENQKGGLVLKN